MKWFQLISYTTDHCDGDLIAPAVWPVHLNIVDAVNELMKELRSDIAQSSVKGHVTVDYRRKGAWSEPSKLSNTSDKVLTTIRNGLKRGTIDCVVVKSPEFVNPAGVVIPEYENVYYIQSQGDEAKKDKPKPVWVTCYNEREKWASAEKAIEFYKDCAANSDGCERERYTNIILKLQDGETDVDDQW